MPPSIKCSLCPFMAQVVSTKGDVVRYECPRCGFYDLTDTARAELAKARWTARQFANASAWVRENQGTLLAARHLAFLGTLRTPTVGQRAQKVLIELERRSEHIGQEFEFDFSDAPSVAEWLSVSWSENADELQYLLSSLNRIGAVTGTTMTSVGGRVFGDVVITPLGYQNLEEMRAGGAGSRIGFCAMWFEPKLLPVWTDAIKPAIEGAGYQAERIDNLQHNNKIDDEIVAMIRKSRFVVADFTGNRGGVYFEAGFAAGLSIQIIWTTREGRLHRVHFDTRQYNFIEWDILNLDEFRTELRYRIEATLGRGPLSASADHGGADTRALRG